MGNREGAVAVAKAVTVTENVLDPEIRGELLVQCYWF